MRFLGRVFILVGGVVIAAVMLALMVESAGIQFVQWLEDL